MVKYSKDVVNEAKGKYDDFLDAVVTRKLCAASE